MYRVCPPGLTISNAIIYTRIYIYRKLSNPADTPCICTYIYICHTIPGFAKLIFCFIYRKIKSTPLFYTYTVLRLPFRRYISETRELLTLYKKKHNAQHLLFKKGTNPRQI